MIHSGDRLRLEPVPFFQGEQMPQPITLSQPKTDVQTVETRSGLPTHRHRPQSRFVYVVYPKSWEYDTEHGFIPVMRRLTAKPGANGVDGRGNLTKAVAAATQKGGTYIDPKDTRLGPYVDYVQYFDCDNGGKWYVDFCSKATVLSSGEIIWNTKEAAPEFARFRRHLVDAGIVPPMIPEVFQWLLTREQNRAQQLHTRAGDSPAVRADYEKQAAKVDAMINEWDRMNGAKAKAKPTKAPRKKTANNILEG